MPIDPRNEARAVLLWLRSVVWRLGLGMWNGVRHAWRVPVALVRWRHWIALGLGLTCASMIFWPTIQYARPAGRRAACQSHLKQLGMALSMYLSDHDERLPDLLAGPPDLRPLLSDYRSNPGNWHCPSHAWEPEARRPGVSYGYNHLGLAPGGKGISREQVADPESLLVLVDSDGPRAVPDGLRREHSGTPPAYRHEGRANALWLDGHVRSLLRADIEARAGATGSLRDFPHWSPPRTRAAP